MLILLDNWKWNHYHTESLFSLWGKTLFFAVFETSLLFLDTTAQVYWKTIAFHHLLHLQHVLEVPPQLTVLTDWIKSINLVTAVWKKPITIHQTQQSGSRHKGQRGKVKQKRLGVTRQVWRLSRYPLLMSGNYANMSWNGTRTIRHSGCLCIYYK